MRDGLVCELMRAASRLAMVSAIGGLAAACSGDSLRLSQNPLSNPFNAGKGEPSTTGSIGEPSTGLPRSAVRSTPLEPVRTASLSAPPAAARMPSSGPAGWSTSGGTPVVVGPGETVSTLATRYGVPESAILSANDLSSGQVSSGRRVVIPVYSATGVAPSRAAEAPSHGQVVSSTKLPERPAKPAPKVAEAKPEPKHVEPKHAEAKHAEAKVAEPKAARSAEAAKAHPRPGRTAAAEKAEKPAPAKVAKAEPAAHPRPGRTATAEKAEKPARAERVAEKPAKVEKPERVAKAEPAAKPVEAAPLPSKVAKAEAAAPVAAAAPAPKVAAAEPDSTASAPASGGDFRWPARGRVITGFGGGGSNEGINIAVPDGTPVKAAGDGTVAYAGSEVKGYGNLVLIRHDNGFVSAYAHNGEVDVKRGQKVTRGQTIAKSGQSGNVTSPQLHFEIRKGATPVDPMRYLASN